MKKKYAQSERKVSEKLVWKEMKSVQNMKFKVIWRIKTSQLKYLDLVRISVRFMCLVQAYGSYLDYVCAYEWFSLNLPTSAWVN